MSYYNIISVCGLIVFMMLAWLCSTNRRNVNKRVILTGLGLQFGFAAILFWTPGVRNGMTWFNERFKEMVEAAGEGQNFVFGPLSNPAQIGGFSLATMALPLIVVFSAVMGLLYFWRIMPMIIRGFAWLFFRLMRISGAESLCASSNIFVGIESLTTIRPYLRSMTRSELCTVLTAGMATIASTVLAAYAMILSNAFPGIAGHLVTASLLSAPAAILLSKLVVPEDEEPDTMGKIVHPHPLGDTSWIEAIINGATAGMKLLLGVVTLLLAFIGIVGILNWMLGGAGLAVCDQQWSIQQGLGYIFYPFAILMGIPPEDAMRAGQLLGERAIMTEVPAYINLAEMMKAGRFASPRTPVILAYGLCGFAHIASMAIFVGGAAALAPERKNDLAKVGLRALLAATLACLMTGAVAGALYHDSLSPILQTP